MVLAPAAMSKDCRLRASHGSGGRILGRSLILVDRQRPPPCVLSPFSWVTDPIVRASPSYLGISGKSHHRGGQGFNRWRCVGWGGGEAGDTITRRCEDGKGYKDALGRGDLATPHGSPHGLGPGEGQAGGKGGPMSAFSHPLTHRSAYKN